MLIEVLHYWRNSQSLSLRRRQKTLQRRPFKSMKIIWWYRCLKVTTICWTLTSWKLISSFRWRAKITREPFEPRSASWITWGTQGQQIIRFADLGSKLYACKYWWKISIDSMTAYWLSQMSLDMETFTTRMNSLLQTNLKMPLVPKSSKNWLLYFANLSLASLKSRLSNYSNASPQNLQLTSSKWLHSQVVVFLDPPPPVMIQIKHLWPEMKL